MTHSTEELMKTLHAWARIFFRRSTFSLMAFAREQHLSQTQVGTIMMLRKKGTCSVSEIGDQVGITSAAASQMLDRLVQQGLIKRIEDPEDRRAKLISLSEEGERLIQEGYKAHRRWLEDVTGSLSEEEQIQITQALRLLLDHTEEGDMDDFEGPWH